MPPFLATNLDSPNLKYRSKLAAFLAQAAPRGPIENDSDVSAGTSADFRFQNPLFQGGDGHADESYERKRKTFWTILDEPEAAYTLWEREP